MQDNRNKFSGKAEHHSSTRSSYSEKLLDELYERFGFSLESKIADISSGTAFSEQLLKAG